MHSNINDCCRLRPGAGWCVLSGSCSGWGCRLLTVVPDVIPSTSKDRAKLFSRIYRLAEDLGVLECPHFNERALDALVDNDSLIAEVISLAKSDEDLQI